ncbi:LptF/LptG family permease [Candidatus Babeliales bacterium]|nr:LptF/LptG family permease [Candidatus Babeliales bacterium]
MLFLYFLKRFYKNFLLFFSILVLIFGVSDLVVRLPLLSSFKSLSKIFILMFPLMAQFAIPISSCLSVQNVCGKLYLYDEIVIIYFFSKARKSLQKAVLFFSISIIIFYVPLVFVWAPQSYKNGKDFILRFAKEQFYQLEPNKFYNLVPGFTFFFKKKEYNYCKPIFKKLLLMCSQKGGKERYIVNAKNGYLLNNTLFLEEGVIQSIGNSKHYFGSFKQTQMNLESFFDLKKEPGNKKHLKFFTWEELKKFKKDNAVVYIEYYKRIAQIFWQIIFPFLGLWSIMVFAKRKSNLLISIFLSGFIFLFSYLSLNFAQMFYNIKYCSIFIMYFSIFVVSFVLYGLYRNKR